MTPASTITIITGAKEEGKSTLIKRLLQDFHKAQFALRGLFSPAIIENRKKKGIAVEDISTGKRMRLAIHEPGWDPEMPDREWKFKKDALRWSNEVLKQIEDIYDVLIIDEIGYLEFEKKQGWESVFSVISDAHYLRAYIVVRTSLIGFAEEKWPDARIIHLSEIQKDEEWIQKEIRAIRFLKEARKDQCQKQQ